MEAIVVGLALLAIGRLGDGLAGPAGWYTGVLALAMLVSAFVQRRPWGLGMALVLQVAMVAGWFAHPALGGLGLLFVLVWAYLLYVRQAVARRWAATRQR
jgi:Na+/melibiose symporter-like transporter